MSEYYLSGKRSKRNPQTPFLPGSGDTGQNRIFELLHYKPIRRLFQDMVLQILYYVPFRGAFPSLSYFFWGGPGSFLSVAGHNLEKFTVLGLTC